MEGEQSSSDEEEPFSCEMGPKRLFSSDVFTPEHVCKTLTADRSSSEDSERDVYKRHEEASSSVS